MVLYPVLSCTAKVLTICWVTSSAMLMFEAPQLVMNFQMSENGKVTHHFHHHTAHVAYGHLVEIQASWPRTRGPHWDLRSFQKSGVTLSAVNVNIGTKHFSSNISVRSAQQIKMIISRLSAAIHLHIKSSTYKNSQSDSVRPLYNHIAENNSTILRFTLITVTGQE